MEIKKTPLYQAPDLFEENLIPTRVLCASDWNDASIGLDPGDINDMGSL